MTRLWPDLMPSNSNAFFAAAPPEAPGILAIDLDQLAANWQALRDYVAPAQCAAVVKADAYGLGADRVIPALAAAGCRVFFVATLAEARQARTLAPQGNILVLDGITPGASEAYTQINAWPVLSSLAEIKEWGQEGVQRGSPAPCALHIDTGLNRLGMSEPEIRALAGDTHLLGRLDIRLVMSHLACADEPDHPKNAKQHDVMRQLRPLLPNAATSLAASDGIMLGPNFHFDLVRPGYALYGGQASKGRPAPVKPVVQSFARVLQVRDLAPGGTVGYSASYSAEQPRRIAVIAAGYADGFFRHLSAAAGETGGFVAFSGKRAPVVGRVSMDLITTDVTAFNDPSVVRGDWAEILGPTITLEEMGAAAGTIGYETLTRLGRRFHRVYLERDGDI
ncbi:alanine racemase [Filomicrobium sp.]|uniref:alanine racemase n=1 Tax=Filomicrobium sp. TaxID=2024831 RepID=UPI00258B2C1A|nr:alanine racemase [Filomicrobium sp.]